jgi:hypothetical protein
MRKKAPLDNGFSSKKNHVSPNYRSNGLTPLHNTGATDRSRANSHYSYGAGFTQNASMT